MPKEEWGTKRLCPQCATRFYDLQSDPMTCPACGAEFTVESLNSTRSRSFISGKTATKKADQSPVTDDDDDVLEDDESGDLDDDLLDDDDEADVSLDEIADVASESDDDD